MDHFFAIPENVCHNIFDGPGGFEMFCLWISGPGCSKIKTSLVNVSLKFQMLVS